MHNSAVSNEVPNRSDDARPTVCVVAHAAYGALTGGHNGQAGGVENQTSMTARWLTARSYPVCMVTWDEGQPNEQVIDGVRVIKLCSRRAGLKGLRFFHPRWTK